MSVRITKKYHPVTNESLLGWKWFILSEDGNLGPFQFSFPAHESGPLIKLDEPMESEHGYCLFTDKATADLYKTSNAILLEVWAVGRIADGLVKTKTGRHLKCSVFRMILIREHGNATIEQATKQIEPEQDTTKAADRANQ